MSDPVFDPAKDYCTDWFDRIQALQADWGLCCYQHDLDYSHLVNKFIADWNLASCVTHTTTSWPIVIVGILMWAGVTLLGLPFYFRAYLTRKRGSK